MKSINLWEDGLSDGRYVEMIIDKPTSQVRAKAVYITEFRREEYEDNGAQCLSFLVSSLEADMKTLAGEPVRKQILLGQRPSPSETSRYFPLKVIDFYLKMCEFEEKGGEAFFIWNEEHHRVEDASAETTNQYRPRPATLMSQYT